MRWKINYWDLLFGFLCVAGVALLMLVIVGHEIAIDNRKAEMQKIEKLHSTSTHTFFKIYYKEGRREEVECDECVYGQTDDKIYFLKKSGKDTVKVVPKIIVDKVTTLDESKAN